MHHIATVIFPSAPAPSTSALAALLRTAFPEARVAEVEDGLDVALDAGHLFIEVDDRTPEALDATGRSVSPPDPSMTWPDDADARELFGDDAPAPHERPAVDPGDAEASARFAEATRYLHLGGDFEDPADVISLLEVLLRAAPDAQATDASGAPLPLRRA